ncbi:MAG: cytochrome ubiquinol oxidase subunit I [Polyangia bacterium]
MNALTLARAQFALTVMVHYLYPALTMGLGVVLVIVAGLRLRRPDEIYDRMARFWTHIFGVVFAGGVATGVVMEFEFGTNWASYSRFVGDIFGAPLAAEALIAFFLESSFLSILLFGEKRVSRRMHWFATLMVALGATLSAFWIVAANSWQQTPAGFHIVNGRAELTSFAAAVFNPSTPLRFLHAVLGSWVTAAVFVGSLSAYYLLRGKSQEFARRSLRLALVFGLVALAAEVVVGDAHTRQVARTQPEKFAAIEVLHRTQTGAPLAVVGQPLPDVLLPKLLSFMTYFDFNARVTGLDAFAPKDRPPVTATAMSFHAMLWLGLGLGVVLAVGAFLWWRGSLFVSRRYLRVLFYCLPIPFVVNEVGWVTAEIGRQPWSVYHLLRTEDAFSRSVPASHVAVSLLMFVVIYIGLLGLTLHLVRKKVLQGPGAEEMPS